MMRCTKQLKTITKQLLWKWYNNKIISMNTSTHTEVLSCVFFVFSSTGLSFQPTRDNFTPLLYCPVHTSPSHTNNTIKTEYYTMFPLIEWAVVRAESECQMPVFLWMHLSSRTELSPLAYRIPFYNSPIADTFTKDFTN